MSFETKKSVAIVGSGPSALLLAAHLSNQKYDISIYEQKSALARKFLVAGDGGFNLTHSELVDDFVKKYTPTDFVAPYIRQFTNQQLRDWLVQIGIETFVGSSKRVFPIDSIKPIQVLNAILKIIKANRVTIYKEHYWKAWGDDNSLIFKTPQETVIVKADIVVFALGGKSWSVTGAEGNWVDLFKEKGIEVLPFQASNCAYEVAWSNSIVSAFEGQALKNISIQVNDKSIAGEVVLTKFGLEGNAIYAHSAAIRSQLAQNQQAEVFIDLKNNLSLDAIVSKLNKPVKKDWSSHVAFSLNLTKLQMALIKQYVTKQDFMDVETLAVKIKNLPITILSSAPIDEAISTVGGIDLNEIDSNCELIKLPNHYAIGEMLDWDAPTGGYLLQACFSMGYALAKSLNE